jgi:hypothetical protein
MGPDQDETCPTRTTGLANGGRLISSEHLPNWKVLSIVVL